MSAQKAAGFDIDGALNDLVSIAEKYRGMSGSTIPILQDAQEAFGYIPEEAVEWLAEQTQERDGVATEFHSDREPKPMTDDVSVILFQAVRELLVNVVKHAQARKACVDVRRDGSEIRVVVADDGVGFAASNNALGSERGGGRTGGAGVPAIGDHLPRNPSPHRPFSARCCGSGALGRAHARRGL